MVNIADYVYDTSEPSDLIVCERDSTDPLVPIDIITEFGGP